MAERWRLYRVNTGQVVGDWQVGTTWKDLAGYELVEVAPISELERVEAERDKLREPGRFVPLDTRTQYEESLERSLSDVEAELKQMERERNVAEREMWRLQNKLLNVRNSFGESGR